MGFKFQFITLAGFHALNYSMFDLAYGYARNQMTAYVELQEREFAAEERGYTATKHQREVGAGYFDQIATTVDPELVDHRFGGLDRGGSVPLGVPAAPPLAFAERGRSLSKTSGKERDCTQRSNESASSAPGQMGGGIAEVCARAGVGVTVFETTDALVTAGRARIAKSLERGVSAGKITERERDAALANLGFTTTLADLADRQLVIEAVIEDETVKADIFSRLDEIITDPDAVLRLQHLQYPDHEDRGCHQESGPGPGAALLQPGAGAPAGRAGHHPGDQRDSGRAYRAVRRSGAGQAGGALHGPLRFRRQLPCWCPICCRRSGWWRRGGHRRGRRQGRRRRLVASHGDSLRLSDLIGLDTSS